MTRNEALLMDAAKRALDYFSTPGYQRGQYDDLIVGRLLRTAIETVEAAQMDEETFARELVNRR